MAELSFGHVYELPGGPHMGEDWWQLAVGVWSFRESGLETCGEGLKARDWPELRGVSGGDDPPLVLQH